MRVAVLIVIVSALALSAYAQSSCSAGITVKAREDDWSSWYSYDGFTHYQIYDIVVKNEGSCIITDLTGMFTAVGRDGFISEGWNYDINSGRFLNYGGALQVGQSFWGAGFVLANSSQPTLSMNQPTCAGCSTGTTAAPTSQPSTSQPSTSQPSTSQPSTANPSTSNPSTTESSGSCAATITATRDAAWWMDAQGRNNSVYRLSVKNAGPCAIKDLAISFGIGSGSIISYWNLQSTRGGYLVTNYGSALAAGSSFESAGLILADAPDNISVNVYGSNCSC